ncbi:MAG TPA: nucleotidyltransferase family protein [Bryobacteraceae bacterium]|nr:nucleotidyltransferase family protein [Bryobacteraceae bacterium]
MAASDPSPGLRTRASFSPQDRLLFAACRQQVSDDDRRNIVEIAAHVSLDWPELLHTAHLHGVAPLVFHNFTLIPEVSAALPEEVLARFRMLRLAAEVRSGELRRKVADVAGFCQERGIRVMAFKGAALDLLVYEQPWYTQCADFDLILDCKREVMTPDDLAALHQLCGEEIEAEFLDHHDLTMSNVLPMSFEAIWNEARSLRVGGHEVWLMSDEDLLLSLCINSCRKRFFRLKNVCDIAEFLRVRGQPRWDVFAQKAGERDCSGIAYAALFAGLITLDAPVSREALAILDINRAHAWTMRWLCGNLCFSSLAGATRGVRIWRHTVAGSLFLAYASHGLVGACRRASVVLSGIGRN